MIKEKPIFPEGKTTLRAFKLPAEKNQICIVATISYYVANSLL